jgi:hypothetical protein
MTLTAEETTLYESRLADAEQAYHDLRCGKSARVFVDQNGERVEFAVANAGRLQAYIIELKKALGKPTGLSGPLNAWML